MKSQTRPSARWGLLVLAALVLAGVLAWRLGGGAPSEGATSAQRGSPPVLVEVAEARIGAVADTIEVVGTTRARQSIAVVPAVSGRVSEILFEAGQIVEAGQPLVRLESALEEANLAEARATLADARTQLDRARQLIASRAVAQARLDELQSAFNAQRARVAAVERRLADRVVVAPFAGIVGLTEVDVGARVEEGSVITRLDDLSSVELAFQVPEVFFGKVTRGQVVEASSPGQRDTTQTIRGTVSAVDTRVDPTSRAFRVRADLPNEEYAVPAGLFMAARIRIAERPDAVLIPEQAVVAEARSTYAWRIRDGLAERAELQLGVRSYGEVEVVEGLSLGDVVVIGGLQRLRAGSVVTVKGGGDQKGAIAAKGESNG